MRKDFTDITLVVDRSGSMATIREDAQGGVNDFIRQQKEVEGEARLTLVEFDNHYSFVEKGTPIEEVQEYKLSPRGGTALLDAVGRAIDETGVRLAAMDEKDRPGLVIVVVITDGHENSSTEYNLAKINKMITHQQTKYNWQFTFLGADQDAFADAELMGIEKRGVGVATPFKCRQSYGHTHEKVKRMRKAANRGERIDNAYTEAELRDMANED